MPRYSKKPRNVKTHLELVKLKWKNMLAANKLDLKTERQFLEGVTSCIL